MSPEAVNIARCKLMSMQWMCVHMFNISSIFVWMYTRHFVFLLDPYRQIDFHFLCSHIDMLFTLASVFHVYYGAGGGKRWKTNWNYSQVICFISKQQEVALPYLTLIWTFGSPM